MPIHHRNRPLPSCRVSRSLPARGNGDLDPLFEFDEESLLEEDEEEEPEDEDDEEDDDDEWSLQHFA